MKHKIIFALLFIIAGLKGFSQDTLKMNTFIVNNFAIIEINKAGRFNDETITIHFDDGHGADVTNTVYNTSAGLPLAQKALKCITYMQERNYHLISSTASTIGGAYNTYTSYDYQYIFERKDK